MRLPYQMDALSVSCSSSKFVLMLAPRLCNSNSYKLLGGSRMYSKGFTVRPSRPTVQNVSLPTNPTTLSLVYHHEGQYSDSHLHISPPVSVLIIPCTLQKPVLGIITNYCPRPRHPSRPPLHRTAPLMDRSVASSRVNNLRVLDLANPLYTRINITNTNQTLPPNSGSRRRRKYPRVKERQVHAPPVSVVNPLNGSHSHPSFLFRL